MSSVNTFDSLKPIYKEQYPSKKFNKIKDLLKKSKKEVKK